MYFSVDKKCMSDKQYEGMRKIAPFCIRPEEPLGKKSKAGGASMGLKRGDETQWGPKLSVIILNISLTVNVLICFGRRQG